VLAVVGARGKLLVELAVVDEQPAAGVAGWPVLK
jgi:hypothetical protein